MSIESDGHMKSISMVKWRVELKGHNCTDVRLKALLEYVQSSMAIAGAAEPTVEPRPMPTKSNAFRIKLYTQPSN